MLRKQVGISDAVRVTSSSSSSSGTKPLPPHVGHCCSLSVPFSTTPSPLQSGQVFTCASLWTSPQSHDVVHRRRFSFPACVGNAAAKPLPNNGGECSKCQHYSWNVTAMAPRNGIVCLLQSLLHITLNGALRGPLFLPIPARRPLPPVRPCVFTDDPAAAHTMDGWKMRTRMETSRGSEKSGPRRRRPLPVAQPKTPVCSITVSRRLARIAGVGQDRDRMKAGGAMSVADLPVALRNRGRSRGENKCVNIVPP